MLRFYLLLFLLSPLALTVSGQEEALHPFTPLEQNPPTIQSNPHTPNPPSIEVSVSETELNALATSVSGTEIWLKTHVLPHYPSTTIVVGRGILCNKNQTHLWELLLPSMKNLYHSLSRWGLARQIKLSAALSSNCFLQSPNLTTFTSDASQNVLNPLLSFLEDTDSNYIMVKEAKPMSRRLSSMTLHSSTVHPPLPSMLAPDSSPRPPPCEPSVHMWCVAKPTVPTQYLQEAMDYACGNGGADCREIMPYGMCYYPDNLVAHASYAFNSYWQKMKNKGGSCYFGGAAMRINTDPSYLPCHFVLN